MVYERVRQRRIRIVRRALPGCARRERGARHYPGFGGGHLPQLGDGCIHVVASRMIDRHIDTPRGAAAVSGSS